MPKGIEFEDSPSPCRRAGANLVACADCGRDISRSARACVHCGRPGASPRVIRAGILVLALGIAASVVWGVSRPACGGPPTPGAAHGWERALRARPEGTGFLGVTLRAPCEISFVAPGSPAEEAGLAPGDRILSIDGHAVTHWRGFLTRLWARKPGDRGTLQIQSNDGVHRAEVTLGSHPDD